MAAEGRKGDKRSRDEKENTLDGPAVTKQRTKYVFGPTNSLTSTAAKKKTTPSKKSKRDAKTGSPVKLATSVRPGEDVSSDDHIFWAPTPRQSKSMKRHARSEAQNLPSSPLENITISPINPMNNIPRQYHGINYDNFSSQHSPEADKILAASKADSFPTDNSTSAALVALSARKPLNDKTRRLLKTFNGFATPLSDVSSTSKKRDIASLINTVESGFTSSSTPFIPSVVPKDISLETPSKIPEPRTGENPNAMTRLEMEIKPSREEQEEEEGVVADKRSTAKVADFSDLFSEDFSEDFMNDLDRVLEKGSTQARLMEKSDSVPVTDPVVTEGIALSKDNRDKDLDSMDSFSDFDDELDGILIKKTQKTASQAKLTTQERHIQNVDREGSLVFKKDIEETDTKVDTFRRADINFAKNAVDRHGVRRFQVSSIVENFYISDGIKKPQKMATVADGDGSVCKIFIRDFWQTLSIEPKDVIHIVGETYNIIDRDSDNMLIWNPDILLSATLVSDTINCLRRSVLKTRFDFPGESSIYLVIGEIVHSVFQAVLRERHAEVSFMEELMEKEIELQLLNILVIKETRESIRAQVKQHLPYIKTWFDLYVKERPSEKSTVRINRQHERATFATSNIIDIEENIWSPIYGLRGLIDVTIEAYLSDSHNKGTFAVPMELKSGSRMHISHRSQAALYTLLMKDRYEMDVNFFMLVYTKLRETTKNEINRRELKDLMMLRNNLSEFMKEGSRTLPPLVKQSQCDRCYALQGCMTVNKLTEDGTEDESGLAPGLFTNITEHLNNQKYSAFFNYWDDLITKEEGTVNLLKKDLFLIESSVRETTSGKCLSRLVIAESDDGDFEENMTWLYTFKRKQGIDLPPMNISQLSKHDRIIVSDEKGHYALCSGFVVGVRPDLITIRASRRLKNNGMKGKDFNLENNQTFQTVLRPLENSEEFDESLTYRIDKDEMFHGMKLARFNLLNLFLKDGDEKRRDLIVNEKKPTFSDRPLPHKLDKNHSFNPDQLKAFNKVLSANDFSLLLGMPGTGKTTVIAQLIRFLVKNKKTVLLTSYTHSAVDNILMKIKDDRIGVLRLGALPRIHQDVRQFSPLNKEIKTAKVLKEEYLDPPVVATTCLGINDWVFRERKFDYCIVDESSQVSMPACLGPLRFCDKFVLVGDHYQLPPLIQNPEAKVGLSRSLFKILSDLHPDAVVDLSYQYRMCSDIMLLSNTIIYEGRLKCGSAQVADQSLQVPHLERLNDLLFGDIPEGDRWLDFVLDPNRKVIFLNHDKVGGCHESRIKENVENPKEAALIYQIVEAMLRCGVSEHDIGVMSFYRAQLRLFYRKFVARKDIEMLTADQFQGRDKECIIISLVKSNHKNDAGSLLKEWRRLNVAITRAKSKLIIVGSKDTLKGLRTMTAFMNILESRGWFIDLPPMADTLYNIDPPPTVIPKTPKPKKISGSKVIAKSQLAMEISEEMGL